MNFETEWACLDFDLACLYLGRQAEKDQANGEKPFGYAQGRPFETPAKTGYNNAKALARRKVKVKPDGTW